MKAELNIGMGSQETKSDSGWEGDINRDCERRRSFLRYVNRGWLIFGMVTLITLPIFPDQFGVFLYLLIAIFPTYLAVRILNHSGKTRLAGAIFALAVDLVFYGLFLLLAADMGPEEAFRSQATVWMLMGLAVLFAGALVEKRAAFVMAFFNSALLIATRLALAPQADARPSVLVFWWMIAIVIWLYEGTLQQAFAREWAESAERRRASAQLRKLSSAVEHSPASIMITDPDGVIEYVNPRFEVITGYPRAEAVGRNPRFLKSGLMQKEDYARLWTTIKAGEEWRGELCNRNKGGELYWESASVSAIQDVAGNITHFVAVMENITERIRAKQALQEAKNFLQQVLDTSPNMIFVVDGQGRTVFVNQYTAQYYGTTPEDLISKSTREVHPNEIESEEFVRDDRAVIRTHSRIVKEELNTAPDGQQHWFHTIKVPLDRPDGSVDVLGISTDITERVRAEAALRQSEARLKLALEAGRTEVWEWNPETNDVYLSANLHEIIGVEGSDTSFEAFRDLIHPQDVDHVMQEVLQAVAEKTLFVSEFRLIRPDGRTIWLSNFGKAEYDEGGKPMRMVGTIMDITERKRAEEALRHLVDELGALYQTTLDIINSHDLPELLQSIVARAVELLGGTSGGMYLCNPELKQVRCVVSYKTPIDYTGTVLAYAEGAAGTVAVTGEPLIIDDYQTWEGRARAYEHEKSFSAVISAPMLWRGQVIGVIHVLHDTEERKFTAEDLKLLIPFANQAAVAVENARLFEETHRRLQELEILQTVSASLRRAHTVHEMLPLFVKHSVRAVGAKIGSIYLYDEASREWVSQGWVTAEGEWTPAADDLHHRSGEGVTGRVGESGQVHIATDWRSDPLAQAKPGEQALLDDLYSSISLPLHAEDRIIGVMHIWYAQAHAFSEGEIQLLTAVADMAGNGLQRARLHEETQRRLERLSSLQQIDELITGNLDLRLTLNFLLVHILQQLQVDAATVLLYHPELQTLEFVASQGFLTQALQFTNLRLGQGFAGKAALERRTVLVSDLNQLHTGFTRSPEFLNEQFVAYMGIPLIAKGNTIGVLEIYHRQPLNPDKEWMAFLETLAGQAAIAIDNVQLFENLKSSNQQLNQAYDATIAGWAQALELRDMETVGHSNRTVDLTIRLARKMGIKKNQLAHIRRGALLHDIGKMGVPDAILQKSGALTAEERQIMQQHPIYAHQWLSQIAFLQEALDIPYCHHEKWDGTGYPRGLKGEQIPLAARIFAAVDLWDALTSDRTYRAAWTKKKAVRYIREQSGKHLDPQVVKAFLNLIAASEPS